MASVNLPTVEGGFGCCLVDPPWEFSSWGGQKGTPHRGAHDHYDVTSTEDLMKIPVQSVMAKNATLFMWVVDSHIPDALALGAAWGFEMKTIAFNWVKARQGYSPRLGMGYWTRKGSELCFLFTCGKPKRLSMGVEQMIFCKRGQHSAKPDEIYERIEALVSGPRLELFARSRRAGWSSWGLEVGARDGPLFEHVS